MTSLTGLAPVGAAPADARLLLLGSLPGTASLAAGRYYAHPRNAFWALLGELLGEPLVPLDDRARCARLAARGVMLWDVIARAERVGSLDAAIRRAAPNPLARLVADAPRLRAIGFNGRTAATIGRRALVPTALPLVDLPSSSPAHARPFADKRAAWLSGLAPYLD